MSAAAHRGDALAAIGTEARTTALPRLVLGLASLHHLHSPAARQRYLAEALELGFRDFDTAPAYGNGLSEHELGLACRGRRDQVTLATKFGIAPPMYGERAGWLFTAMRVADRLLPGYAGRRDRRDYSAAGLRSSVEASLRRLRTDRVDLLLLHEPPAGEAGSLLDALGDEVSALRQAGKILAFGVAGEFFDVTAIASRGEIDVVQAPLAALEQAALPAGQRCRAYFLHRRFEQLGRPGTFEQFADALRRRPPGPDVLIASRSIARLRPFSALLK